MTTALPSPPWRNGYPTSSQRPMPETDWHQEQLGRLDEADLAQLKVAVPQILTISSLDELRL